MPRATEPKPKDKFENYNNISVPLAPLRTEIVGYLRADINEMPLGELLRSISRIIKENKSDYKAD
jgi:hypothetical protein